MNNQVIVANQFEITSHDIRKSTFFWKITDFTHLKCKFNELVSRTNVYGALELIQKVIVSPVFSANPEDLKWCLVMFSSRSASNRGLFSYFEFRSEDSRYFKIQVKLAISILKSDGSEVSKVTSNFFVHHNENAPLPLPRYRTVMEFDSIQDLFDQNRGHLVNDELNILCVYKLISYVEINQIFNFPNYSKKNRMVILDTFEKQWKNREFCDYVLTAPCGRKLHVHRFVLAAQSSVFSAMFKNDMKEKQEASVKIEDISYEVLEEMLRFVYCGKVEKLDHETVSGVIDAAEKYQIEPLKNACEEFLLRNLTSENAILTLKLCKTYNLVAINSHVEIFVKSNSGSIFSNYILKKSDDIYAKEIYDLIEKIELSD